uniref:Uncharacterized protein n=1 Tax=Triparma columacea TaxID=722753 RepID=A0A9W7FW91_9STRA|nr:hypothetical protein TrCOL_g5566 [Triparma columacea]
MRSIALALDMLVALSLWLVSHFYKKSVATKEAEWEKYALAQEEKKKKLDKFEVERKEGVKEQRNQESAAKSKGSTSRRRRRKSDGKHGSGHNGAKLNKRVGQPDKGKQH